ncbi:MAG: oxidoreductase [bacterium]
MKKVALVTGASSGIGKDTARLLQQNGYIVYGTARRIDKMEDLKSTGIKILKMDVTDDTAMVNGVQQIITDEGRLDVLVNNAGYGSYGALEDVPISEAKYQFDVNVFGLARLSQLVIPHMRKQKSGKIINISSIGGKISEPHGAWYHSTKFAVEGLSDCLRQELKQFGLDVVVIEPGVILTEWNSIARDNLQKVSGNTVYKNLVQKHIKMFEKVDKTASKPIVIAKAIVKAALALKPETRYVAGKGAGTILFLRKILSDKLFDKVMLSLLK